ncbi:hypothetical protein JL721_2891 [Aureococcus anophagefferens]|nr:hypothetical protein JL721_2891 [Aureococcus anophagefferens]
MRPRRLLLLVIAGVLAVDAFRMAPRPRPPSALAAKKKKRRKSGAAKPSSAAEAPVAPPAFAFPTAEAIGAPMDGAEVTAPARDVSPALGGRKPDDPLDAFDYGIGGIVKRSVFFLGISAFVFDLYLNSPFFERAAEPPALTAAKEEMAKYQPEKDGGD